MASPFVRKMRWFVAGDLAFILSLFALGFLLDAMKVQIKGNFLTDMLGHDGYLFVPAVVIWIIAWLISFLRNTK